MFANQAQYKLIGPFSQVVTLANLPLKGPLKNHSLPIVIDGGVVVNSGVIVAVGKYTDLEKTFSAAEKERIVNPMVLLPAMTDCHTHICFAGTRSNDYDLKLQGLAYLEIAKKGGGIWQTVQQTRAVLLETLAHGIRERANKAFMHGVTTIEVKSGYGLNVAEELKMLRAIKQASLTTQSNLIPTFLGAHTLPKDFEGSRANYLNYLKTEAFPLIKKERLAARVDIFIEETAFSPNEALPYLQQAKDLGFQVTVHADQFTTGGSSLAIQVGAISADHLEASTEKEIQNLAKSETVAVVLPGASLGLGIGFAPARKLLDSGCCLAIASDWNPGSAPMGDLLTQAALLSIYEKLATAEVFAGLTYRAAAALGLHDRGKIEPGKKAQLMAFATKDYRDILYYQGAMKPDKVWG